MDNSHHAIMSSERIFSRFHPNHGELVKFENDGSVAYRAKKFHSGVVFSERRLHPGELFAVEIEQYEVGWHGSLRIGLTHVNPSIFSSNHVKVPKYALPDLMRLGSTWLYALNTMINALYERDSCTCREVNWPKDGNSIDEIAFSDDTIETCWGTYPRFCLKSLNPSDKLSDGNVGFKIGVLYLPTDDTVANLYLMINGDVLGPFATEIPYKEHPLYAVVDIYGKTKRVRLLQIQARKLNVLYIVCRRYDTMKNQLVDSMNKLFYYLADFLLHFRLVFEEQLLRSQI